ncbi:MAG: glycerophosphodiester phosphodiesterase [Planctomycetaceae bacterium]
MTFESLALCAAMLAVAGGAAAADGPLVIAHRGASGYLPEHTLEAVAMAHAQGADFVEQDVVLTKDGVPVVLHDLSLEAVTDAAERFPDRARADGCRYALDFTLDELRRLRVHERRDHKTGRQKYPARFPADAGDFRIATLAEHLALLAGLERSTGRRVGVYTEIKHPAWHRQEGRDVTAATLAVLRAHGHDGTGSACRLQTFDRDEVRRLRHDLKWPGGLTLLVGEPPRGAAGGRDPLLEPGALAAIAADADGLGPHMARVVGPDGTPTGLAAAARAAGLVVHAYTLRRDDLPPFADSTAAALEALCGAAAIDGVFTDFPDLAVAWRRDRR